MKGSITGALTSSKAPVRRKATPEDDVAMEEGCEARRRWGGTHHRLMRANPPRNRRAYLYTEWRDLLGLLGGSGELLDDVGCSRGGG